MSTSGKLKMSAFGTESGGWLEEMSEREIERLRVLERVRDGSVRQRHAVAVLPLSDRQVRRLLRRYQREGAAL
ncbi:MAG: helix-turn-helix domain-containing protein [Gammaproteobacteria bacterium]|nr:helix-turn-helix domain-containing protein [Gammaproteobacteria bacterium]